MAIINLGCPKNQVDAERIAWLLQNNGYQLIDETETAQIIVINTCGFIEPAVEEAIETILQAASCKTSGQCRKLVVCGCLPQRHAQELLDEIPEIDLMLGTADYHLLADFLSRESSTERLVLSPDPDYRAGWKLPQLMSSPGSAFLKVSEGCDNHCSYCMIPAIKGRLQSVPGPDLIKQARSLIAEGALELNLIAQDLTAYGNDLSGKAQLYDLLLDLCRLPGLERLRLLYTYPAGFDERLIDLFINEPRICPYLDMPIQHISDKILRAMGRRGSATDIRRIIDLLKTRVPELYLRSTVIVGFPDETEADFKELLHFIEEAGIDYLGVFPYWQESGSRAALIPGQIDPQCRQERALQLTTAHQAIIQRRLKQEVGRRHQVLVEGLSQETDLLLEGRTVFQAPEIDGTTYITEGQARAGSLVEVEITDAYEYDLFGRII